MPGQEKFSTFVEWKKTFINVLHCTIMLLCLENKHTIRMFDLIVYESRVRMCVEKTEQLYGQELLDKLMILFSSENFTEMSSIMQSVSDHQLVNELTSFVQSPEYIRECSMNHEYCDLMAAFCEYAANREVIV